MEKKVNTSVSSSKISKVILIAGIAIGVSISGAYLVYRYNKEKKQFKRNSGSEYSITLHLSKSQLEKNNDSSNSLDKEKINDNNPKEKGENKLTEDSSIASELLDKIIKQQISEVENGKNENKNIITKKEIDNTNTNDLINPKAEKLYSEIVSNNQEINLCTENDTIHASYSYTTPIVSISNDKLENNGLSGLINEINSLENSSNSILTLIDRENKENKTNDEEKLIIYSNDTGKKVNINVKGKSTENDNEGQEILSIEDKAKHLSGSVKRKSLTEEIIESESDNEVLAPSTPKLHSSNISMTFNPNIIENSTKIKDDNKNQNNSYSSNINNNKEKSNISCNDVDNIRKINSNAIDIMNEIENNIKEKETETEIEEKKEINEIKVANENSSTLQTDSINPLSIDINKFLITQNFEFSDEEEQNIENILSNGIPIQKSIRRVSSISSTSTFKSAKSSWTESSQNNEDQLNDDNWEVNSISSNNSSTSGFFSAEEEFDNTK